MLSRSVIHAQLSKLIVVSVEPEIFRASAWKDSRHMLLLKSSCLLTYFLHLRSSCPKKHLSESRRIFLFLTHDPTQLVLKSAEPFFLAVTMCPVLIRHNHHCFVRRQNIWPVKLPGKPQVVGMIALQIRRRSSLQSKSRLMCRCWIAGR